MSDEEEPVSDEAAESSTESSEESPVETDTGGDDAGPKPDDLSLVYDVPVTLQVQLGEATLSIGDIMRCGKGSVIPLNQKVGDAFLVTLHKRPLAEGEIVEAGENLGIKITKVLRENSQ